MAVVAMKQLLEAGVHFGHQTRRWDPKMAEYIFQARNGIHIIDLQKTSKKLDEAYSFLKQQAEEGKTVLFVGTKKQAQDCMKEAAEKCGMYYVNQRWLGGTLTNFDTIRIRKYGGNTNESHIGNGINQIFCTTQRSKPFFGNHGYANASCPAWHTAFTKTYGKSVC